MAEIIGPLLFCLIEKVGKAIITPALRQRSPRTSHREQLTGKLTRIRAELEMIYAFLQSGSPYRSGSNEQQTLRTWAKQVQDVAHQIEDIIDEYDYIAGLNDPATAAVRSIIGKLDYVDASLVDLERRRSMYDIRTPRMAGDEERQIEEEESEPVQHLRHFAEDDELVGFEEYSGSLVEWLVGDDPRRGVASVLGMAGVGKTALVEAVYNDQAIVDRFSCRAWVSVTTACKIEDLLRKILKELCQERMGEEIPADGLDSIKRIKLVETLRSRLHRERYLVILDDLWDANIWDELCYPLHSNNCASRVVITTRKQEVTSGAADVFVLRMEPLPEKLAWRLFRLKAFQGNEGHTCPQELEHLARAMVDRCEGLPHAIIAIADLLSRKERLEPVWRSFHDSLTWTIAKNNTSLQVVSKSFNSSIRDLPLPLRNCLMHCTIFPEDYPIGRNRLIRLWVAEGFVKATGQRTMEEVAEDYLNQLAGRCLLQVIEKDDSTGRISSCRIYKLVRELLVASRDGRFAQVLDGRPEDLMIGVRRLSITSGSVKDDFKDLGEMMQLIRSLHLFPPALFSTSFLSSCRLLQVLDLCNAPLERLPEEVGSFFNLRYLSVRCTGIRRLPRSVEKLSRLETLDAVHSHIEELPIGIGKLKHLRHLMVKRFHRMTSRFTILDGGTKIPGGIGGLEALQTLKAVVATEKLIRQMRKMRQIRSLDIRGVTTIHSVELSASLSNTEHLLHLAVMANLKDDTLLLGGLVPPPGLRKLRLYGKLHKGLLPPWFGSLRNLTHLVLKMSRLKPQAVPSLMALPNLESLFLMQTFDGERLSFPVGSLNKLRTLGLCDMLLLSCVEVEETALEQLRELKLVRCCQLRAVPQGIERLTRLQKVELEDMPCELVEGLREWRPARAVTVIKSWRSQSDGRWDEEEVSTLSSSS